MKKYLFIIQFILILVLTKFPLAAIEEEGKTALVLIDIQNFYFTGGKSALENPEKASLNAAKILQLCRQQKIMIIHVRHQAKENAEIHVQVAPKADEKVITKTTVNSFLHTDLLAFLQANKIKKLIICGMMTHMCVEAAVRAGSDLGFDCTLVGDACATRALKFAEVTIPAQQVHYATLASLSGYYARVIDTAAVLKEMGNVQ